jgi:hypothetical protein
VVFTIAGSLFVYKSCTKLPENLPGLGNIVPIIGGKPKPTTHNNTTTTTTTTVKPGETTTTTVIIDKTVTNPARRLRIDIGVATDGLQLKAAKVYDVGISYRIFDHVWVGGAVYSDKRVGLRVGVEL